MPYIGFLPAFWSGNEVKSRFCANALTSKADPTTAKRAADAKATVIAEAARKKLRAAEAADPSVAAATPGPDKEKALAALPARIAKSFSPALSTALAAEPTLDLKKTEKVTEALSPLLFDPKDTTPCFWYKWAA